MGVLGKARARVDAYARRITSVPPSADRVIYLAISELHRRSECRAAPAALALAPYELKVFSQNGEDGILDEILRRIGSETRTFVEFGGGTGEEATCVYLADVAGWAGHFIEGDAHLFSILAAKYELSTRVTTTRATVTSDTVEGTFSQVGVPEDVDVLSIDIDSHDYWVWRALTRYRPRVVVVEYNAHLGSEPLVLPVDADPKFDEGQHTAYFGASITALQQLGQQKGYRLVHCDITGVNAFFVRDDLAANQFLDPADVVLRSPNYHLSGRRHRPATGRWENVVPQTSER